LIVATFLVVGAVSGVGAAVAPADFTVSANGTSTTAGSQATVSFTTANGASESAYGVALNVTDVPSEWNLASGGGDGTYSATESTFLYFSMGAGSAKTSTVTVDVPAGAAPGEYQITGQVVNGSGVPVETVTATVTVTQPYTVSATDASVVEGENATSTVTVQNDATESAAGLATRVNTPDGFTIGSAGGDGTFSSDENTFLYLEIAGESSAQSSVTLTPAADVGPGTYNGTVELVANGTVIDTQQYHVRVTESVTQKYDDEGDGLDIQEVQTGIRDFASSELSIRDVQKLIRSWAQSG
jgi:uncharacterized membrane protein